MKERSEKAGEEAVAAMLSGEQFAAKGCSDWEETQHEIISRPAAVSANHPLISHCFRF